MSIKTFRERNPAVIGVVSIIVIAALVTFAFYIDRLPFIKQAYPIEAHFANAAGLRAENQVRVAGIKVGTVSDVKLEGDRVIVTMEIDNDTDIPDDAFAEIKLVTLLGTKFVDIEAKGGGPYLQPGDVIPLERTQVPYEIYQASNQGTAVLEDIDGQKLKKMFVELARLVEVSRVEIGDALAGFNDLGAGLNAKREDLRSLLAGANDLTAMLSDEGDTLVRLIDASNAVLGSLADKREDVQSLLESTKVMAGDLASLIRDNRGNIDRILVRLHRALRVLERNVEHLDMAFEYAGPSTRYFASVFTQGRWGDIYTCALVFLFTCEQDERH